MNIADFHMLHAKAHERDFCHEPSEGERPHWQFKPGQSGNPAGRPKGSKNRGSALGWALLDDKTAHLVQKAIEDALAGDKVMLRACLTRALPAGKARPIELELPEGASPQAALEAAQRAMLAGEISSAEALGVVAFVSGRQESEAKALALREREMALQERALKLELLRLGVEKARREERELQERRAVDEAWHAQEEVDEALEATIEDLADEAIDALPAERLPSRLWTEADRRAFRAAARRAHASRLAAATQTENGLLMQSSANDPGPEAARPAA